jgi:hypothetical protein
MDVQVNTVYIGTFPSEDTQQHNRSRAIFTNNSIRLTVQSAVTEGKVEKLLILKRDIVKIEACFQSANPFFGLMLKHVVANKIARKMGIDQKKWIYDTRRNQDSKVGWMTVFINLSLDFAKFLGEHFLANSNHDVLDHRAGRRFLASGDHFWLQMHIHSSGVLMVPGAHKDAKSSDIFIIDREGLMLTRKAAQYMLMLKNEKFNPSEGFDTRMFSYWLLVPAMEEYLDSLTCSTCGKGEAVSKCSWCKSVRYCDTACQVGRPGNPGLYISNAPHCRRPRGRSTVESAAT